MRMREGICKLLAVSTQKDQTLHAVKNLMVCNARILAYRKELQREMEDSVVNRTTGRSVRIMEFSFKQTINLIFSVPFMAVSIFKNNIRQLLRITGIG